MLRKGKGRGKERPGRREGTERRAVLSGLCSEADATETHGARSDEEDSGGSLGSCLLHVVTWGLSFVGVLLASIRSITVRDGTRRKGGYLVALSFALIFTSRRESNSGTLSGSPLSERAPRELVVLTPGEPSARDNAVMNIPPLWLRLS